MRAIEDVAAEEIAYVQYSDVPRTGLEPGKALDRFPAGQDALLLKEILGVLTGKWYARYLSYEAPNPSAWARPAEDVARKAREATLAVLP